MCGSVGKKAIGPAERRRTLLALKPALHLAGSRAGWRHARHRLDKHAGTDLAACQLVAGEDVGYTTERNNATVLPKGLMTVVTRNTPRRRGW
jgi:hypothetical protein